MILFEELIFPNVLEEVVLLLAEGSGGTSKFEVYQARNLDDLSHIRLDEPSRVVEAVNPVPKVGFNPEGEQKWTPALLELDALAAYQSISEGGQFSTLLDWGETYLGTVTGHNDYFTLTKAKAAELNLPSSELLKISPPGSKHLRGLTFSDGAWEDLASRGKRCYLFSPYPDRPSDTALKYIAMGSKLGVNQGYKCRNRRPWWRVPLVGRPDLFFTYMNHDQPRLTANDAGAASSTRSTGSPCVRIAGRSVANCCQSPASTASRCLEPRWWAVLTGEGCSSTSPRRPTCSRSRRSRRSRPWVRSCEVSSPN